MENEIIDLGNWFVPKNWDDLTLGQFQQMQDELGDGNAFDVRKVLHIFCGKSQEEVDALPVSAAEELLGQLVWLHTSLPKREPTNKITVNGEEYLVNTEEEMKVREFVQVDSIMKSNPKDYASILAVLCRKKGEKFDAEFEAKLYGERREMFLKAPMLDAMAVMAFFLRLWNLSKLVTQLFLEALRVQSHMRKDIENSPSLGAIGKSYMRWRMARLWKSTISKSNIYRSSSSGSHSQSRKVKRTRQRTSFRSRFANLKGIKTYVKRNTKK